MKKLYRVGWLEDRYIDIETMSSKKAEEIAANGEFDEEDVISRGITEMPKFEGIVCPMCKEIEDDDGRCRCTNKDGK